MKTLPIQLAVLLALAATGCTSCSKIQSVGIEGGYAPATGEITAGITITFKTQPPSDVVAFLEKAGATGGGTNWVMAEVTNQTQRLAINSALLAGAELHAPPKKQ